MKIIETSKIVRVQWFYIRNIRNFICYNDFFPKIFLKFPFNIVNEGIFKKNVLITFEV